MIIIVCWRVNRTLTQFSAWHSNTRHIVIQIILRDYKHTYKFSNENGQNKLTAEFVHAIDSCAINTVWDLIAFSRRN